MTSVTHLRIAGGAGDPDSVPARQLDVVLAAEALIDAQLKAGDDCCEETLAAMDLAEHKLELAVRKLRGARKARGKR